MRTALALLLVLLGSISAFAGSYVDIDGSNLVTNLFLWDGVSSLTPQPGHQFLAYAPPAALGCTWNGTTYVNCPIPTPVIPDPAQTAATVAALNAVQALIPTPSASVPLGPSGAGIASPSLTFVPASSAQRQSVQRFRSSTDASGNYTVTWATPFVSNTPIVSVNALNPNGATNGAVVCNAFVATSTTASGRCWQLTTTNVLVTLVGALTSVLGAPIAPSTSMVIMVVGAEPTQ